MLFFSCLAVVSQSCMCINTINVEKYAKEACFLFFQKFFYLTKPFKLE
jgi:hypothetical protein